MNRLRPWVVLVVALSFILAPANAGQLRTLQRSDVALDVMDSGSAIVSGMWTSTKRQTNADDLEWNEQVGGDPEIFGFVQDSPEIALTVPGVYLIQTRIPVYGTPGQQFEPAAIVTVTCPLPIPICQESYQRAFAGRTGFSYLTHMLLYVKTDTLVHRVVIGFGADEEGWTQGAVLVIEKLQ